MGLRPVVSVFFLRILILFLFCATGARGALAAPEVASFKINNGAATTANPAVTLPNICEDAVSGTHFYMASESADFTSATWKPYASVPLFVLSRCAGEKTVYFKIRNSTGLESAVTSDTITLSASGHVVVPFGNNSVHQSDAPSPATEFVSVSAGTGYSLGLKSTGSIVAWGSNTYNKCVVPEPNSGFAAIAAGHYHSLGLKSDGSILAWGLNDYNQCTVPQPNREFVAISAGYLHNIGLKADGSVVTWGLNNYGQCGYFEPNTGFVAVAAGYAHNLALRADGSIRAWGGNEWGQCTVPEPNRDFIAIAAGWEHSLGLKSDGSIVAWGYNYSGQCDVPSPNTGFVAVAAGYSHSLGLKADGSIVAWGRNDSGECNVPAPNQDFAAIAGGLNHSLALTIEGSVKVTLTPAEAVAAGARWRLSTLEKGTWHDESEYDPTWVWNQSDDIVTTQTGTYNLKFKTVYGWEKPANRSVDITTTGTAQVTAAYTRTLWTLETSCTHGSIQVSPAGTSFPHETTVTLSVQPAPGYWFDRWVGDVPKGFERATSFTLEMNADKKNMGGHRAATRPADGSDCRDQQRPAHNGQPRSHAGQPLHGLDQRNSGVVHGERIRRLHQRYLATVPLRAAVYPFPRAGGQDDLFQGKRLRRYRVQCHERHDHVARPEIRRGVGEFILPRTEPGFCRRYTANGIEVRRFDCTMGKLL